MELGLGLVSLDASNAFIDCVDPLLEHEEILRPCPTDRRSIGARIRRYGLKPKLQGQDFHITLTTELLPEKY